MADRIQESQSAQRRIFDTKTRRDIVNPIAGSVTAVGEDTREQRTEKSDLAAVDGPVRAADDQNLVFCRDRRCRGNGPFTKEGAFQCPRHGRWYCRAHGTQHDGVWFCRWCTWKRRLRTLLKVCTGI
jgi:hypothetical protein